MSKMCAKRSFYFIVCLSLVPYLDMTVPGWLLNSKNNVKSVECISIVS